MGDFIKKNGLKVYYAIEDELLRWDSLAISVAHITAASCFSEKSQENQGLWEFERGFLYQI